MSDTKQTRTAEELAEKVRTLNDTALTYHMCRARTDIPKQRAQLQLTEAWLAAYEAELARREGEKS